MALERSYDYVIIGAGIPHDVLLSLPYLATVFGLWISGRMRGRADAVAEASGRNDE